MKRHEMWRQEYREHRYLEFASNGEVDRRYTDLVSNVTELTLEAKIGLLSVDRWGSHWLQRITHAMEEFQLRGRTKLDVEVDWQRVVDPRHPNAEAAARLVAGIELPERPYLVRFGSREYMASFWDSGQVFVNPASTHADPSLKPARFDDELAVEFQLHPADFLEALPSYADRISTVHNVTVRWTADRNYYALCLTEGLTPRLFLDFGYDACVVITKPQEFLRRLTEGFRRDVGGWNAWARSLDYLDPVVAPSAVDVPFAKHFRYWYRHEFRVVWQPEDDRALQPVLLRLGPLKDVGDFYVL